MAMLPHLFVLSQIRNRLEVLRNNPSHIGFALEGYGEIDNRVMNVYGAKYIDRCIQWFQSNSFTTTLGYRLDMEKLPSISILYEGGREKQQWLGDYGSYETIAVEPKTYALFDMKDLDVDGNIIVSKSAKLDEKIWRGLLIKQGKIVRSITSLGENSDGDLIIFLSSPLKPLEITFKGWAVVSQTESKLRVIGSSLDAVKITVYLTIAGDPEICEMVSCVLRYILKQSRLGLADVGLNEATFQHGSLSRYEVHEGSNVWQTEFVITGLLTDRWIISESLPPDRFNLAIDAESSNTHYEEVRVYED